MKTEAKMEKLEVLFAERKEARETLASIEQQIADLIDTPAVRPLTALDRQRPAKTGRKCGNCYGIGHTARTCERPVGSAQEQAQRDMAEDTGSDAVETEAFDEATFSKVREALARHGSSKAVAEELDLPLQEVNRAVRFKYFAWYEKNRLKM